MVPTHIEFVVSFGVSIVVSSFGLVRHRSNRTNLHSSDELDSQGKFVHDLKTIIPLTI